MDVNVLNLYYLRRPHHDWGRGENFCNFDPWNSLKQSAIYRIFCRYKTLSTGPGFIFYSKDSLLVQFFKVVHTEIPANYEAIFRHRQKMKYRVNFFSKYRNTGQKKDQSRDTGKVQTPLVWFSFSCMFTFGNVRKELFSYHQIERRGN